MIKSTMFIVVHAIFISFLSSAADDSRLTVKDMKQEKNSVKHFRLAPEKEANTTPKQVKKKQAKKDKRFIPSESISEDLSVSFPIDI